jgi:hypothetical protein
MWILVGFPGIQAEKLRSFLSVSKAMMEWCPYQRQQRLQFITFNSPASLNNPLNISYNGFRTELYSTFPYNK